MTRSQYLLLFVGTCSQTSAALQPPTAVQTPSRGNTPLRHERLTDHETTSQTLRNQDLQSPGNLSSSGIGIDDVGGGSDLEETPGLSGEEQPGNTPGTMDGDIGWNPSTFLDGIASYMRLSDEDREELYAFAKVSSHTVYCMKYSQIHQCSLDMVSRSRT